MKHKISKKERVFTSTGEKLLYHKKAMKKFQKTEIATPITMHIMPTSYCNLRCNFCSVKNRKHHEILDLKKQIIPTVEKLKKRGLKSVIISGGGEPMMYREFEKLIDYLHKQNLEIGMITNGTLLRMKPDSFYEKFTWIRISINSLENNGEIYIPKVKKPVIGFSYIVNELTNNTMLKKIKKIALKNNIKYIRLLPDCAQSFDKVEKDHKKVRELVKKLGNPFFHQYKIPLTPKKCYLGFFHPVLYCDGKIYPCDSLVLNDHKNQQFKEEFAICDSKEIEKLYKSSVYSLVDTKKMCPNCVFKRQNDLLIKILQGEQKEFKEGEIEHKNFI
jgi:radical SAM protein with 4Fe4S-binding SPASM domain